MRVLLVTATILVSVAIARAAEPEPVGDPGIGRALYTGEKAFEKGGPACAACHAMGGQGAALTASLGPDLSYSKAALDLDVLDGVMADQPYRSMKPLYKARPISAQERAHVVAWVRDVAGKQPARGGAIFAIEAAAIAVVIGALLGWGRRKRMSVREELQLRARRVEGDLR